LLCGGALELGFPTFRQFYFFPNEASALLHLVSLVGFNPTVASIDLGAPKVSYTLQAPSM